MNATPTPAALLEEAQQTEERGYKALARAAELRRQADDLIRQERPIMPTLDMLEGIVHAVELATSGQDSKSHHGDPCAPGEIPYVVVWSRGWLSVRDLAPYESTRAGNKLWRFEDAEVEAILAAVQAAGGAVQTWWRHHDGISVRIAELPALPLADAAPVAP